MSGLRVLVIDDNVDGASSLASLVRLWGFEAQYACDGRSALDLATEFRPNVVFCDLAMPGMSGLEVSRKLRGLPELSAAQLVAVTAYGTEQDRNSTREAGFQGHLVKPVEPETIRSLLCALSTSQSGQ